ncbi:hypothetical protein BDZ91DRAFT_731614 [Kalaharituber pfeilii]|nr:hypothetical protein BDZ91DRAFT_731614 [Kalaharituber pfeilii]
MPVPAPIQSNMGSSNDQSVPMSGTRNRLRRAESGIHAAPLQRLPQGTSPRVWEDVPCGPLVVGHSGPSGLKRTRSQLESSYTDEPIEHVANTNPLRKRVRANASTGYEWTSQGVDTMISPSAPTMYTPLIYRSSSEASADSVTVSGEWPTARSLPTPDALAVLSNMELLPRLSTNPGPHNVVLAKGIARTRGEPQEASPASPGRVRGASARGRTKRSRISGQDKGEPAHGRGSEEAAAGSAEHGAARPGGSGGARRLGGAGMGT